MRMDFELVRRETANRVAAEAYARGRAEGRAEAAATRPPPPKPTVKPKPAPKVIEHLCPNGDPMSSHRGRIVLDVNGKGECDYCHARVWDDS
jgi:hypothetical protein